METWTERTGVRLRAVLQHLADHGGSATRQELMDAVAPLLPPNEEELVLRSNGTPKWLNDLLFQTTNLVKAGWMTKDGSGNWAVTDAGLAALQEYPDSTEFHRESSRKFQQWRKDRDRARQRAWLIRGSSVLGVNIVPEWLAEGFVSLAASQLRELQPGITAAELEAVAAEDYSHLKHQELKAKVEGDCRAGRGHLSWLARRGGLEGCSNAEALSAGVPRRCREGRSESPRGGHARADRG